MAEKRLFLFDAYALIYRAHFAFSKNPRINSKGFSTGCVLGFTNTMIEILKKENPTHVAIAFDTAAPTFRHIEFEAYKAQREAQPEDIALSIPIIKDLVRAFNIPVLEKDGFEADDIIGTVAKAAAKENFEVYMMTPDKDYAQLVEETIFLYKPNFLGKGYEIHGIERVLEKWDIEKVDQVRDVLGLQGDAVDNIPGIPGIGGKTASKLLKEYGSVESIVENVNKLKGKLQEKVKEFGEQGILSKHLATIKVDVPIEIDFDSYKYEGPDEEKVTVIFDELEFRTLKKRLFGVGTNLDQSTSSDKSKPESTGQINMFDSPANTKEPEETTPISYKNISSNKHHYHLVDTKALRKNLIEYLLKQEEICFDTETTDLDALEAKLVGMSFSYLKGEAYYVPVSQNEKEAQEVVDEFKIVFENEKIRKIGQNLKYDILVLQNYNIQVKGELFDTMLAHYLLEPDQRHNMDVLAENYLNYKTIPITELIGKKGAKQGNMADLSPEKIVDYASEDADITFQLKKIFELEIKEKGFEELLKNIEAPLIHVLADIERTGVNIDTETLADLSKELEQDALREQKKIFEIAGEEFNVASPKQLGVILFDKLKLDSKAKKTKTGQYATGEEILSRLAKEHEIADRILRFREYQKLKSTYVDALPKLVSEKDSRVHTDYRQAVAATGRLSSNNPNLQNIPIRTERGREIRKAFVPADKNHVLLSADYSQIELRIMASFSKDESMIDAFQNGRDIHSTTASKVFKVPLEKVEPSMRRKAKEVNFGLIYGISAFGLAQNLQISRTEATEIINSYWEEFPSIKQYMDKVINDAREFEYVETILGRRRYLRDINSRNQTIRGYAERNAINAPIQGSAADMIKVAMINIHQWMKEEQLKSKMILQVHDELVFDTHLDELDLIKEKIPHFMKTAIELDVPMEVEYGVGKNWLEAH